MSQFLWIEDFGDVAVGTTTESVFGEILGYLQIPANKYRLIKFLKSYGVLLKLDFLEALDFIRNPEQLRRVDYIILDVWLPVPVNHHHDYLRTLLQRYDNADEQIAITQLEKTAGYQLYVELVMELGFPKEHILFCSNHAEELGSIRKAFKAAKIELPEIHTKGEEDRAKVQAWVRKCRENPYSVLRRGILNVLDDIEDKNINLSEAFEKDVPVNKDTFLDGLRFMLSTLQVQEKRQHLYRTLCDYLTKYFDRFSSRDLYKGMYKENGLEIEVPKEYVIPAYLVRNWVAHNIINNAKSEFCAQDVGFLFSIVMKAMFDYSSIETFKSLYSYPLVNDRDLQTVLCDLHNRHYSYSGQCEIFELIRLKGQKNWNRNLEAEDFVAHMYASFLFGGVELKARTKAKPFTETATTYKGPGYWVNLTYLIDSQGDTLFESLKSIAYHRLKERNF